MAGTDRSIIKLKSEAGSTEKNIPAVILVEPQLGENIGMVARAMLNCGLTDLRLVRPRDGWPNSNAIKPAAGADIVLNNAKIFRETDEAIADLELVFATTARNRDMTKEVVTPEVAANEIRSLQSKACGILFGRESKGLKNEDIVRANKIVIIPLNTGFTSLNLSQAVLIVAYEWFKLKNTKVENAGLKNKNTRLANKQELLKMFEHLESELDYHGFLRIKEKRPTMVQNIRNIFERAKMTDQEVQTFRGIIKSLTKFQRKC